MDREVVSGLLMKAVSTNSHMCQRFHRGCCRMQVYPRLRIYIYAAHVCMCAGAAMGGGHYL